jgi:hypothetical protein
MALRNWDFFLAIESDLAETARFVHFSPDNFETFSIEFSQIMMAACAEIDTVAKQLCARVDAAAPRGNIADYQATLTLKYPRFYENQVLIPAHGLEMQPWRKWSPPTPAAPPWWQAYNAVKHDRGAQFGQATLENALNAVAGLMIIVIYERGGTKERRDLWPEPKLLHLEVEPTLMALSTVYEVADDRPA